MLRRDSVFVEIEALGKDGCKAETGDLPEPNTGKQKSDTEPKLASEINRLTHDARRPR